MDKSKFRFWIIIASIAATVILILGGLYIALDFIEEHQERQQRQQLTQQQSPPPGTEEAPDRGQGGGNQQNRELSLNESREIAERHLQSRDIQASFRNHSGIDHEAGTRVWELEYRGTDGLTHEFYIDVYTGDIVKFETGDWD